MAVLCVALGMPFVASESLELSLAGKDTEWLSHAKAKILPAEGLQTLPKSMGKVCVFFLRQSPALPAPAAQ